MFLNDLLSILTWYIVFFVFGLISFPLIFLIFKKFIDRAYIFSKITTPVLISFLLLLFGVFKIIPFSELSISLLALTIFLTGFFLLFKTKNISNFLNFFKKKYKLIILEELIFLIILIVWSFLRAFNPSIEGLEKYMDWGFINSILRTKFLPPQDMWFSGSPINYYYFGHLIFALATKVSHLSSAITYNLSIATVCALTFVSTFSLSLNLILSSFKKNNLKKIILISFIPAILLTFGGNLHTVYKTFSIKNENLFSSKYWYPDATRFIGYDPETNDKTIHEFPVYSFVVSDLHGHMNGIPLVLFFITFLFHSFLTFSKKILDWRFILISSFLLAVIYMTNAWDFAVYGLLIAVFSLLFNSKFNPKSSFYKTVLNGLLIIIFWFLFTLPFSKSFQPMMQGIKATDSHTPFYKTFILYGGFWLISFPFYFSYFSKKLKKTADIFVLSLIITATLLILIPEFVYIKDIYIYEHRRANTMFKLVYQAFILYSVASGYILLSLSKTKSKLLNVFYKLIFSLVVVCHLIYPYFAITSFYSKFKDYQSLNGLNYLETSNSDNFKAINWLNDNVSGQPVVLEAVGDSYTTFNQVSVSTGLPTIQGWIVHEWLWRGGYELPKQRQDDVKLIYESEDLNVTNKLIDDYQVKYIFVGNKEFEKYSKMNPQKFIDIGAQVVFHSGQTTIYRL